MPATIDLKKAHLSRFHGDLAAIYTWINDERALVLVPWRRKGAPWFIVMESAAYQYDDPTYLAIQCAKACEVLGLEPSRANWVRVASIIHEGLPDLVRMPSAPPAEFVKGTFGEMAVRADGAVVAQESVRIEREGARYA